MEIELTEPLIAQDQPSMQCQICMLNYSDYVLVNCGHTFCTNCLKEYLKLKIIEENVLVMKCPETSCSSQMYENEISLLLQDEALLEKYKTFLVQKQLESNIYFRWCPRKNCGGHDLYKDSNKLKCSRCEHEFCFLCAEPWHSGKCKNLYSGSLSDLYSSKTVKNCPICKIVTEKMGGCSHIYCNKCQSQWCWRCEKLLSDHDEYKCFVGDSFMEIRWDLILPLLFFPISLIFIPVILVYFAINFIGLEEHLFRFKTVFYIIAFSISPLFFAILFSIGVPLISMILTLVLIPNKSSTSIAWGIIMLTIFLTGSALGVAIIYSLLALLIIIAPIVGFALTILKLIKIITRRNE